MMGTIELAGRRFGRLTVAARSARKPMWLCVCDCGLWLDVRSDNLRSGNTQSCGCVQRERSGRKPRHGHARARAGHPSRAYMVWDSMVRRCTNPGHRAWRSYGGRGITVCERWRRFENFLKDMGEPPPGLSLDRINNDGNYEPGNCRWATPKEQANNRRPRKQTAFKESA